MLFRRSASLHPPGRLINRPFNLKSAAESGKWGYMMLSKGRLAAVLTSPHDLQGLRGLLSLPSPNTQSPKLTNTGPGYRYLIVFFTLATPPTSTSTTSPSRRNSLRKKPTPDGVPVMITVPFLRVIPRDR